MTEMVVATSLATLLVVLLATAWTTFGSTALEVEARARLEREALLSVQSIAYDLSGFLNDDPSSPSPGWPGGQMSDVAAKNPYQFLDWGLSNPGVLTLNYSGGSASPAYTVTYQVEADQLVRTCTNLSTAAATRVTVARHLAANGLSVAEINPNEVQILLTFSYRNITSTFTLIGIPPSS